uniref:P24 n=1 Tax=Spodoptera frugiperda nuclear polyhedrosis virus TaxID=10455 RepID=A0A7G3W7L3_NPVSF|nr:P24 [Spodoptera frugiperda multiple nucleopolyhedrovirus]
MFDSYASNNFATNSAGTASASDNSSLQFQYNDKLLEVVIIENSDEDRDGYVELNAAAQLIAPIASIRGFSPAVMWANTHNSQKLTRNNKNYVHVFSLGKYLSMYKPPPQGVHRPELLTLKQLIGDLLVGAQSQIVDPLLDIKTQLCTLQECITNNQSSTLYESNYDNLKNNNNNSGNNDELLRDMIRAEHASLFANINNALENIKNMQADLTNKIAFSNDTMLDGFKSIKDMMNRKK